MFKVMITVVVKVIKRKRQQILLCLLCALAGITCLYFTAFSMSTDHLQHVSITTDTKSSKPSIPNRSTASNASRALNESTALPRASNTTKSKASIAALAKETLRESLRGTISIPIPAPAVSTDSDCLMIILGQTRAHKLTWPSFQRHFLNRTHCDIALAVGSNDETDDSEPNPFYQHAKYIWKWNETQYADDEESWTNALYYLYDRCMQYFPQRLTTENRHRWIEVLYDNTTRHRLELGPVRNTMGSGAIQLFFRLFAYLNIVELGLVSQYKYMMHARSDYKYLCAFPFAELTRNHMEMDSLWITSNQSYGGITDKSLLAPSHLFMNAIDVLLSVFLEPEKWREMITALPKGLNIEVLIRAHFIMKGIEHKVRTYDQPMFAVRDNDTWTRWGIGEWDEAQQLIVKKRIEFEIAKKVCHCSEPCSA